MEEGTIFDWLTLPFVESCIGFFYCLVLLGYCGASFVRQVNFITALAVSGAFFSSNIYTFFDPRYKLFFVMADILIAVGALTGGSIGMLLPKISTGFFLGCLLATFAALTMVTLEATILLKYSILIFVVLTFLCIFATQRFYKTCADLRNALVLGFVFTMSVDNMWLRDFCISVQQILQYSFKSQKDVSSAHVQSMLIVWLLSSIISFTYLVYRAGAFRELISRFSRESNYIPLARSPPEEEISTTFKQRTFYYPDTLVFNYIDPDDIPELLKPFAEAIFTSAQVIMKRHGFQVDNTRNQAEHLIMLLFNETKPSDKIVSVPALRIHRRMFQNYCKWCERLAVRPLLLKDLSPIKTHDVLIEDMLLFLLIWGEAANLRHLPECLCFLFHKIMEEHLEGRFVIGTGGTASSPVNNGDSERYAGYFLDMIVTPIYEEISKSLSKNVDHSERKIYDDFNELCQLR